MASKPDVSALAWTPVEWLGDSRDRVRNWPKDVKCSVGDDLAVVQLGEYPHGCEPLPDVGKDVHCIRVRSGKEQYRVVWLAKIEATVYVLHAFHKKSKRGIETPKHEKEIAKDRLKALKIEIANRPQNQRSN
jgi:phage-related protein